jgi:hypothetical protein
MRNLKLRLALAAASVGAVVAVSQTGLAAVVGTLSLG